MIQKTVKLGGRVVVAKTGVRAFKSQRLILADSLLFLER